MVSSVEVDVLVLGGKSSNSSNISSSSGRL